MGYAKAGIPVFPLKPGEKKPLIRKCQVTKARNLAGEALAEHARTCPSEGHGHHDATTDPGKIREWWEKYPEANIGVPTGERSGWLVVDQDHPAALEALEAEHGALPATRTHGTGSGGMHFVFSYPTGSGIRNSAGRLAEYLDVRGEGGYVVVPPSRTERPYEALDRLPPADPPAWLLRELTAPRQASTEGAEDGRRYTPLAVLDSGPIPKHRRNDTVTSIAGMLHDGTRDLARLTADLIALEVEEPSSWPAAEVAKIAASIHSREPCRPQGKRAPEEVRRALLAFEEKIEAMTWSGHASNRLSLLKSYVLLARKHGELREDGVAVSVSNTQAADHNRVSLASVKRGKAKLVEMGLIRVDNEGRNPTDSAMVVLLVPASGRLDNPTEPGCEPTHNPQGCVVGDRATHHRKPVEGGRLTSQRGWSATRARHGKPQFDRGERIGYLGRMGKPSEKCVDKLERAGGRLLPEDLASAMGIKRARNMYAAVWFSRLLDAGVVEWDGEGYLALTADWLAAWDRRRVEDDEEADRVRDRDRHRRMSKAWAERVAERAEERRRERLDHMALVCHDGAIPREADGFIGELEPVQDGAHAPEGATEGAEVAAVAGDGPGGRKNLPVQPKSGAGHTPLARRIPQEASRWSGDHMSELAKALRDFLLVCPHRAHEKPGWLANYAWSEELVGWKPTPEEAAGALAELETRRFFGEAA